MPFFILKGLQMKRSTMVGIYTTFALGLFDIAVSLARFLSIQLEPTSSKSLTMIRKHFPSVWLEVEPMPTLKLSPGTPSANRHLPKKYGLFLTSTLR